MNKTRKCQHCQKIYFVIEDINRCPFCGKEDDGLQAFKDLFGDDNPFNDVGIT